MRLRALILSLLVFAAVPASHAAASEKPKPAFILAGEASTPPRGFVAMCERDTSFCGSDAINKKSRADQTAGNLTTAMILSDDDQANFAMATDLLTAFSWPGLISCCDSMTFNTTRTASFPVPVVSNENIHDRMAEVVAVNRQVNGRVRQVSDRQLYGVEEFWTRSTTGTNARGDCEDLALEKRFKLVEAGFDPERLFFAVVYNRGVGLHTVLVARLDDGDFVLDSRTPYVNRWYETPYSWVSIQSANRPGLWFKPGQAIQMASNEAPQKKS